MIKICTQIINEEGTTLNTYSAIKNKNHYVYHEETCTVKLFFTPTVVLIRENEKFYSRLEFSLNHHTDGIYTMKREQVTLPLEVATEQLIVDRQILIQYIILTTGQKVTYILKEV